MYKTSDEPIDITITRIQEYVEIVVALLKTKCLLVYNVVSCLDHVYIQILLDIGKFNTCTTG